MSVPMSRILDLAKSQCQIFSSTFNPERLRLGNKILRQRLKGPSLAQYYPRKVVTWRNLQKAYPQFEIPNEAEEDRLEHIEALKLRGKNPPKKKRTAAESKKFVGKKKKATAIAA
ncbi:MAG: mitochondral 37S ribosomal protein S27 [Stictis urceolatum]|nr:mitochondral 37S ribosomal protein S27 [Stictis urceolata]